MSENLKNKLAKLEAKIQPTENLEEVKRQAKLLIDLEMLEFFNKQDQASKTPEEYMQSHMKEATAILVWYSRYQNLTEEERKLEDAEREKESEIEREKFLVWKASDEGKKFYEEYDMART